LSQLKKYHPFGNLEFNNLGIFHSLEMRILVKNILSIALKLFTPNGLLWVKKMFMFFRLIKAQN